MRVSTWRMKADSFEPPGRRGEARGWGRVEGVVVVEALVEDGAGERRKLPAPAGGGEGGMV